MKPKIPVKRVPSDDCLYRVGIEVDPDTGDIVDEGEAYPIHEGEWVEIMPFVDMNGYTYMLQLQFEQAQQSEDKAVATRNLAEFLAEHVYDWNWTDIMSRPLDKPFGNPDVFMKLSDSEWAWLIGAIQLGRASERKNGSRPSETTSLTAEAVPVGPYSSNQFTEELDGTLIP